jgi:hypothetical protein
MDLKNYSGRMPAVLSSCEATAEKTASIPEHNYLLLKIGRYRAS